MDSIYEAAAFEEVEQLLARLISIESHSDVPDQEKRIAEFIRDWCTEQGIDCWLDEPIPSRPNVIARLAGRNAGKTVVLNGHLDTVPPYGMSNPFQAVKIGNRIYGRGSVDMKGALAAMLMTLAAIRRSGLALAGDVYFIGTVGEESYSPGAFHLSRSKFRADYTIIGEPTGMKIGIAHKGVAWYEAEFEGRSVHGSVPEQGVNAVYRANRWISHIQDHYLPKLKEKSHPLLGSPTLNIGVINGGTRPVIVPNHCSVLFERRLIPGESAQSALTELESTLEAVRREYPDFEGKIRIMDNFHGVPHGAMQTPPESLLVKELIEAYTIEFAAEGGLTAEPVGLQFWTDGALLQEVSAETVVCGPGNIEQAHSDDEYIEVRQLHGAYRMYLQAAIALAGQGGDGE